MAFAPRALSARAVAILQRRQDPLCGNRANVSQTRRHIVKGEEPAEGECVVVTPNAGLAQPMTLHLSPRRLGRVLMALLHPGVPPRTLRDIRWAGADGRC